MALPPAAIARGIRIVPRPQAIAPARGPRRREREGASSAADAARWEPRAISRPTSAWETLGRERAPTTSAGTASARRTATRAALASTRAIEPVRRVRRAAGPPTAAASISSRTFSTAAAAPRPARRALRASKGFASRPALLNEGGAEIRMQACYVWQPYSQPS
jgi:hypothetical protein